MGARIFEKEYRVHVYETGPDGRLSFHSLFDYLQDIASEHAVMLGYGRDELMKENHYWVLSRMYTVIDKWPSWSDTVIVRTWPKGTEGVFALRDYEVFFPDGRKVACATSSWLIIDQTSKRIQRPDNTLSHSNYEITKKDSLPRNADKIDSADADGRIASDFKVRISDLDINLHTNNVKYLKWVTDCYDLDFVLNNIPYSAEINYLAESRFNDNIVVRISEDKENRNVYNNSILRLPDKTELCRIRISWKKNHEEK